jgi:hypothetical protein
MGWYVRKSVRMGPVRWNLSKSGIGMSVGVRGLRVGTGPRGPYVAGGRGGLYFRQPLGRRRRAVLPPQPLGPVLPQVSAPLSPPPPPTSRPFVYLPETQVGPYTAASADTLARYISAQRAHKPLFWWVVGPLIFLNTFVLGTVAILAALGNPLLLLGMGALAIFALLASGYGVYAAKQWDRQRMHVVLHYDLDSAEQASYQQLCAGLQALATTMRLARVDARQVHGDWKRHAGATTALRLSPAVVMPPGRLPWLETNVPVWSLHWRLGRFALIFLPDRLLVEQGGVTAAVPYPLMQVTLALSRFVENGLAPPDARILSYTWQYTNKDGSPDQRFKANRQLPVTEAAYIAFQSPTGVTLMLQASSREKATVFVQGFRNFQPLICAEPPVVA